MMTFTYTTRPPPKPLHFLAIGHQIQQVELFKFLDLWFNQRLTWRHHISMVVQKCLKMKRIFLVVTTLSKIISTSHLI